MASKAWRERHNAARGLAMTAILGNANRFTVNTDYPFDKVIYQQEFSYTVPQSPDYAGASLFIVPHGLPFRPLCGGVYSDTDFSTTYEFGSASMFFDPIYSLWGQRLLSVVESDATNIYLFVYNRDSQRTVRFRVFGFADSAYSGEASPTSTITNNFLLNTDNNYMKVLTADQSSISVPGTGTPVLVTVPHVLGYPPFAMAWTEVSGRTSQATYENYIGVSPLDVTAALTNTSFTVSCSSSVSHTVIVHWRVYVDA